MTGRVGAGVAAAAAPRPERGPGIEPETEFVRGLIARASADPAFLRRFAAVYEGHDDPLDALCWLERPDEPGPSGAVAPAAVARAARRALYGPGTDSAALEGYERASAAAERSRASAVAALARLPLQHAAARAGARQADSPREGSPRLVRPSAVRPLAAAAVALGVVAGAAGFGLGRTAPAASPAPALTEHIRRTVPGSDAAAVFARAPDGGDLLGGDLEPLDTVNLRRLTTVGGVRFLAARTVGDAAAMCLIAVDDTSRAASRCVSLGVFERDGVLLTAADGLPAGFARVLWQPDGRLVWWSPSG